MLTYEKLSIVRNCCCLFGIEKQLVLIFLKREKQILSRLEFSQNETDYFSSCAVDWVVENILILFSHRLELIRYFKW